MTFDYKRCSAIARAQRANYPYLKDETVASVVGTIMAIRRKKVHITADFIPALNRCKIPLHQMRGYAQAAADYFNQHGLLIKHGRSYGIHKRLKARKPK